MVISKRDEVKHIRRKLLHLLRKEPQCSQPFHLVFNFINGTGNSSLNILCPPSDLWLQDVRRRQEQSYSVRVAAPNTLSQVSVFLLVFTVLSHPVTRKCFGIMQARRRRCRPHLSCLRSPQTNIL